MDFLASIDLSPLLISLKTAIIATVVAFFGGIACARWAMKLKPLSKSILDGILNLPLVLPPTVAGFLLLLLFSLKRPLGIYLWEHYKFKVVLSWPGCVLAATVVALYLCRENIGIIRVDNFQKGCYSGSGTRHRIGYNSYICKSFGRIRRHLHAGRQYSGKDQNYGCSHCRRSQCTEL